jgi:hypothetical protein
MKGIKLSVLDRPSLLLGTGVGLVCGSGLGYFLARRALTAKLTTKLEAEFEERFEETLEEVKQHYDHKFGQLAAAQIDSAAENRKRWAQVVAQSLGPVSDDPRLEGLDDGGVDDDEEGEDIFELGGEPISPPLRRNTSKPYAIAVSELGDDLPGYQNLTITWYMEDDTLVDDKDQPIRDVLRTVGPLDPNGFGGLSGDPNIRYVRNEKLEINFEIVLDRRSYTDVVLGYGQADARKRSIAAADQHTGSLLPLAV